MKHDSCRVSFQGCPAQSLQDLVIEGVQNLRGFQIKNLRHSHFKDPRFLCNARAVFVACVLKRPVKQAAKIHHYRKPLHLSKVALKVLHSHVHMHIDPQGIFAKGMP